jgi:hypothetical protein
VEVTQNAESSPTKFCFGDEEKIPVRFIAHGAHAASGKKLPSRTKRRLVAIKNTSFHGGQPYRNILVRKFRIRRTRMLLTVDGAPKSTHKAQVARGKGCQIGKDAFQCRRRHTEPGCQSGGVLIYRVGRKPTSFLFSVIGTAQD